MRRSIRIVAVFMGLISWVNGQAPPEPTQYKIVSEVKLVMLDVAVRDFRGNVVSGLRQDNFHVFDNGKEQPISVFSGEDAPVTLGLVIDHSGSMKSRREDAVLSAFALVRESNSKDEVFVVSFGDSVSFALPPGVAFTNDQDLLRGALAKDPAEGRTALYDAIRASLDHLAKGTRARKALVLISDGGDTTSVSKAPEVIQLAKASNMTIHAIGIYDENEKDRDIGFLQRLTRLTGGEFIVDQSMADVLTGCRRIAAEIRSQYSLGYHPPDEAGAGTRKIHVTVSAPDRGSDLKKLSARTREYYVIPPGAKTQ
jgi:Ca-activated chloride channel family protein